MQRHAARRNTGGSLARLYRKIDNPATDWEWYDLNADFGERDANACVSDCGKPTVGGCEGGNFFFAFELIAFVSRPGKGQLRAHFDLEFARFPV